MEINLQEFIPECPFDEYLLEDLFPAGKTDNYKFSFLNNYPQILGHAKTEEESKNISRLFQLFVKFYG